MDIPTVPSSLWVWIPPMSTDIRVLCCPWNCRRDPLLFLCKVSKPTTHPDIDAIQRLSGSILPDTDSLLLSPSDRESTDCEHTAGRCCLYRGKMQFSIPVRVRRYNRSKLSSKLHIAKVKLRET